MYILQHLKIIFKHFLSSRFLQNLHSENSGQLKNSYDLQVAEKRVSLPMVHCCISESSTSLEGIASPLVSVQSLWLRKHPNPPQQRKSQSICLLYTPQILFFKGVFIVLLETQDFTSNALLSFACTVSSTILLYSQQNGL